MQAETQDGSRQCMEGFIELEEMACELRDNGITVVSSYCDTDGFFHISMCGAETGRINIFEIPAADFETAEDLGFLPLNELSGRI